MTTSEILFLTNFLQNHINSAEPTYEGSTFGEWRIRDEEFFIDTMCYVIDATVTKYFNLDSVQHEYFGTPCTETYATNVIVSLDTIVVHRLEDDGEATPLTVPISILEKQLS